MKQENYKWILYSITLVVIATIGIQVYWNYKNYVSNKQEYIQDIQHVLDESIEEYYANIAKEKSTFKATYNDTSAVNSLGFINNTLDSMAVHIFKPNAPNQTLPQQLLHSTIDSLKRKLKLPDITLPNDSQRIMVIKEEFSNDTLPDSLQHYFKNLTGEHGYIDIAIEESFQQLTSQIVISLTSDTLDVVKINEILKDKLHKNGMAFDFELNYKNSIDEVLLKNNPNSNHFPLHVYSESVYLPKDAQVKLSFSDIKLPILKRIYVGLLISAILILAIISCLFYLLKVIQKQKQIGEIKNDFISNITHEFKTPIATISVALESIRNFNASKHPERSETYLDMSKEQLDKLNTMVEKLLETATLDSNNIELFKEEVNIIELVETVQAKFKIQHPNKNITYNSNCKTLITKVDVFHFENVINNLIDNALKYGGDDIIIDVRRLGGLLEISIKDSGQSLSKTDTQYLFEKFYRQPSGNTHDVKGFGIGLYYSKKIIDKHHGQLTLSFNSKYTIFKITMPYA